MPYFVFFLTVIPLVWLLPNHYLPWLSAWQDGLALLLLFSAAALAKPRAVIPRLWALALGLAACTVVLQWATGRILFGGDALMVLLYLAALALAIALGSTLPALTGGPGRTALDSLALGCVLAALASVGIALVQWTGAVSLGIWAADLPPGGRPFGNVAQPNHLCMIGLLGLAAAGVLKQQAIVGNAGFWASTLFLMLGMVMSGSRTGWLQIGFVVVFAGLAGRRNGLALSRVGATVMGLIFLCGVLAWPQINELLMLQQGRSLSDTTQAGTRALHWAALVDAVWQQPLWGYGWQQVSVAQVRNADTHPFVGEYIEHSHNIVLDLIVWNGLPIGGVLVALLCTWFLSRLWRCRNPVAAWLLMAVGGLGIHGMLEFPLEYAYFLIPLGLFVGAIDTLQPAPGNVRVPAKALRVTGAVLAGALVWIGTEYLTAEQAQRTLRIESAHIGVPGIQSPPPDLPLLTQLDAFLRFAQTAAREGMSPAEVDRMRKVSERFASPSVMFRYALATGLNGQPERAALTLNRLCRIHPVERCNEAREGWRAAQNKFAVLRGVPPPALP